MLESELDGINKLISTLTALGQLNIQSLFIETDENINKIRVAWNNACFSRNADRTLRRYFQFHLQGILEILDFLQVSLDPCKTEFQKEFYHYLQKGLTSLVGYLKRNFYNYLDLNIKAPICISQQTISLLVLQTERIETNLNQARIATDLKACLLTWLEQLRSEAVGRDFTLAGLDYKDELLTEIEHTLTIDPSKDITGLLSERLISNNFNYLGFFHYRQKSIRAELVARGKINAIHFFQDMKIQLKMVPESDKIYDYQWPDLRKMLLIWVDEEIVALKLLSKENNKKMQLLNKHKLFNNVSVAHLACLIQLFYKENYFGDISLTDIFKFTSLHYRTKRQDNISKGSLSKEFYSINQITAARVKDQLQRMIIRINHDFFPVLVVATLIICFQSKS
jgi:hypothetical protein